MTELLSAQGLRKQFGDFTAVNGVNLEIREGEIVALLGPNGAGKSTTLRMVTGLLEPDAGTIVYDGYDLSKETLEAKRQFGFVADQPMMLNLLTGWEYIQFIAGLYGEKAKDIEERAMPLVERFRLKDAIHKRATSYSHGMQQKLALIAQLAHRPRVMLADEPSVGLDPGSTDEMLDVLRDFASRGNGVLLSTHLLEMTVSLATRIVMMAGGRVVANGSIDEITSRGETLREVFMRLTGEGSV